MNPWLGRAAALYAELALMWLVIALACVVLYLLAVVLVRGRDD